MLALLERPAGPLHTLAKEAVALAYEAARHVNYAPHSPEMDALRRAEDLLAEMKTTLALSPHPVQLNP